MTGTVPTDAEYRIAATAKHHREGELEIDDNAPISRADGETGAYVQAWIWMPDDEVTQGANP